MNESSVTETHHIPRRAVVGWALGGIAALTGHVAAYATPQRDRVAKKAAQRKPERRPIRRRKPRSKVVTRTFRNSAPIVIRDDTPATPYPTTITVAGLKHGRLLDLNVTLSGFEHEHPRDIDLLLVAPSGRSAVILSDVGGNLPVSNLTIVLDDQAALPLPPLQPFVSGIYQPSNQDVPGEPDHFPPPAAFSPNVALSTFTGINPNGTWKLYLVDDASSDIGFILGGWALTIRARVRA